jgi:membrane associated rhomboid family serine protease
MSSPTPDPSMPDDPPAEDAQEWYCYRHPDREVGVRCTRCERPICPEDMRQASVGFHCPECVKGAPEVRSLRSLRADPHLTRAIIAVNVVLFLPSLAQGAGALSGNNPLAPEFGLFAGPASIGGVAAGEWWRIVTSGFLHYGLIHLGFNMFILYQLGLMMEPALGKVRFGVLYAAGLLGGSFGALLLSPNSLTAGASGAVFGLMGAAVVLMHKRGVNPMQSGIGGLLLLNVLITFTVPGISIGGHLGGLAAGAAAGALVAATDGSDPARRTLGTIGAAGVAVLAAAGALTTAVTPLWPF